MTGIPPAAVILHCAGAGPFVTVLFFISLQLSDREAQATTMREEAMKIMTTANNAEMRSKETIEHLQEKIQQQVYHDHICLSLLRGFTAEQLRMVVSQTASRASSRALFFFWICRLVELPCSRHMSRIARFVIWCPASLILHGC